MEKFQMDFKRINQYNTQKSEEKIDHFWQWENRKRYVDSFDLPIGWLDEFFFI